MKTWLLYLYPLCWRVRYGAEFLALLEQTPLTLAAVLDIVWGALDAHMHPMPGKEQIMTMTLRIRWETLRLLEMLLVMCQSIPPAGNLLSAGAHGGSGAVASN